MNKVNLLKTCKYKYIDPKAFLRLNYNMRSDLVRIWEVGKVLLKARSMEYPWRIKLTSNDLVRFGFVLFYGTSAIVSYLMPSLFL